MNKKELDFVARLIELISDFNPTKKSELTTVLRLLCVIQEDNDVEITPPKAVDAVRFRMDQQSLRQRDLVKYFGSKSHVSEFLNGKSELSKGSILKLHKGLGIPYSALLNDEIE